MGYSAFYQAVPEASDLYLLLSSGRAENSLLEAFWKQGGVPLDLRECGEEELAEVLDWYTDGDPEELAATRVVLDRLEATIATTAAEHLGLLERSAFLEKTSNAILQWIEDRSGKIGREEGTRFAQQILFGNARLGEFGQLDLPLVREAAAFFAEPDALILSPDDDSSFGHDLRSLANLCIIAAECDEIILMAGD